MANAFLVILCFCFCLQSVFSQFGFFQPREAQNGVPLFGQSILQAPGRLRNRLSGLIHNRHERPIVNGEYQNGQPNQNQYTNVPVVFPDSPQYENPNGNVNFEPNQGNNEGNQNPGYEIQNQGNNGYQGDSSQGNQEEMYQGSQGQIYEGQGNQGPVYNGYQNQQSQGNEVNTGDRFEDRNVGNPVVEEYQPVPENDPVNFEDDAKQESPVSTAAPITQPPVTTTQPPVTTTPPPVTTTPSPVTTTPSHMTTTLAPLTPVSITEPRNNFNFANGGFAESCQTVDGGVGSCISVLQCEPYVKMIQEARTNPATVQLLRRAHCGFEGNNPKVCCPRPGLPNTPLLPVTTTTTTTTTTPAPVPSPSAKTGPEDLVPALLEPPICGFSNASAGRVVGGVDAKLNDFPWMALLGYKSKRSGDTGWLCGGALVSARHVLTAAHCIHNHENDLYVVRLGELDLAREDDGAAPIDVLIKRKVKHEDYSPKAFTNDIGILVLEREVQFTDMIRPICIPQDSELRARTFENYNPIIAGWGHTQFRGPSASHLQVLQLPVVTNDFCAKAYSQYKTQKIDERVLCAGYEKGGKDACQGDSGGPLMQPIWSQKTFKTYFYQIGVVSYGKKCAEAGFPGVYSRVTHYVPWLRAQLTGHAAS